MMNTNKGFSLIEILATLIILSIVFAIVVPKFFNIGDSASNKVIDSCISTLNSDERLVWTDTILAKEYVNDSILFNEVKNYDIGGCEWISLSSAGGTIKCEKVIVDLIRKPSTIKETAKWKKN